MQSKPRAEMRAKFGLSLSTRAVLFDWGTMDDVLDMAEIAETSDMFHGIWVGDNLLSKPRVEAIVTLSALAARTKRVKLGTICLASFPLRDPILLALQWASLDVLSKGRTILAVCSGAPDRFGPQFTHELEVMGPARTLVNSTSSMMSTYNPNQYNIQFQSCSPSIHRQRPPTRRRSTAFLGASQPMPTAGRPIAPRWMLFANGSTLFSDMPMGSAAIPQTLTDHCT